MAIVVSGNSIRFTDNTIVQATALNGYTPYITFNNLTQIAGRTEFTGDTIYTDTTGTTNTSVFFANVAFFTASNVWTVPNNVSRIGVIVVGGGRGGTFPTTIPRDGDQGGPIPVPGTRGTPAGFAVNVLNVTPFETINVTIGAGGAAGGSSGGLSKFANLISFGGPDATITANSLVNVRVTTATANSYLSSSVRPLVISAVGNSYPLTMSQQASYKASGGVTAYTITQTAQPGAGGEVSVAGSSGMVLVCY